MRSADYNTRQKAAILEYLKTSYHGHTTARDIVSYFKDQNINIGQATIYRALEKLERDGVIKRYVLDGLSSACFEYIGDHSCDGEHYHLKCDECGKLIHFHCDSMKVIHDHMMDHHGFQIDTPKTIFYGKWKECN